MIRRRPSSVTKIIHVFGFGVTIMFTGGSSGTSSPEPEVVPRIVNGADTEKGRYPYMATLRNEKGEHECGGTLIAPDLILSAAHCAVGIKTVQLGRYNLSDEQERLTTEVETFVVDPNSSVQHPSFEKIMASLWNEMTMDFLIIKLFGASVHEPVELNDKNHVPFMEGFRLNVMGWGQADAAIEEFSDTLKETNLLYVSNKRCEKASGYVDDMNYYDTYSNQIFADMMCAKGDSSDACFGDSGGPLIVKGAAASADLQLGIVSWGAGCGDSTFPGVYSRISNQWQWIRDSVCELSGNPPPEFGCTPSYPDPTNITAAGEEEEEHEKEKLLIRIDFDQNPWEQGYLLTSLSDGKIFAHRPISTFDSVPYGSFEEIVEVESDAAYKFVLLDEGGDGFTSNITNGTNATNKPNCRIYRGLNTTDELLVSIEGTFGYFSERTFNVGNVALQETTRSPTSSPTSLPTSRAEDGNDTSGTERLYRSFDILLLTIFLFSWVGVLV